MSLSLLQFWTQAVELERVEMEINVNLQGVGLSLVNNILRKEIAYMSISRCCFNTCDYILWSLNNVYFM